MVFAYPFKNFYGGRDICVGGHNLEARFSIKGSQRLDADFGNQLIDADATRLSRAFQAIC